MINAVLVFNNAGQPRLTKFYTQLVNTDNLTHHPSKNPYTNSSIRKHQFNNGSFQKFSHSSLIDLRAHVTFFHFHLFSPPPPHPKQIHLLTMIFPLSSPTAITQHSTLSSSQHLPNHHLLLLI